MPIDIDGLSFAGFPAFDSVGLKKLGHEGRIRWLRHRFQLVFGTPLEQFLRLERPDCYIWLCALTLMCAATEALSRFEFDGSDQDCFVEFVNKYFSDAFRHCALTLGPRPEAGAHRHRRRPRASARTTTSPAEHLYKYFRCGLAHSFCIEWGGLRHRGEDGIQDYLFEVDTGQNSPKALGVIPRELVEDFGRAVTSFFDFCEG